MQKPDIVYNIYYCALQNGVNTMTQSDCTVGLPQIPQTIGKTPTHGSLRDKSKLSYTTMPSALSVTTNGR